MRVWSRPTGALWLLVLLGATRTLSAASDPDAEIVHRGAGAVETPRPATVTLNQLSAGTYLIEVRQLGVDLHVGVLEPVPATTTVNTPTERLGPEYLVFDLEAPHDVGIRVSAPDQSGVSGRFALTVYRIDGVDPAVSRAFRSLTRAGELGLDRSDAARTEAIAHQQSALDAFVAAGDELRAAYVHLWLGMNHYWPLRLEQAEHHYRQAAQGFARLGRRRLAAGARVELAATIMESGRFDEAEAIFDAEIATLLALGDDHAAAVGRNYQGLMELYRGDRWHARPLFRAAEAAFLADGDLARAAQTRANLAYTEDQAHNLRQARELYAESLQLLPEGERPSLRAIMHTNLANVERRLGNVSRALVLLAEAKTHQQEAGMVADLAWTLSQIAANFRQLNDHDSAIAFQRQAVELRRTRPESGGLFDAVLRLGDDYLQLDRKRADAEYVRLALAAHEEAEELAASWVERARAALALARDRKASGDHPAAEQRVRAALAAADRAEDPFYANLARVELAGIEGVDPALLCGELRVAEAFFRAAEASRFKAGALHAQARYCARPAAGLSLNAEALAVLRTLRRAIVNPWMTARLAEVEYPIVEHQLELLLADRDETQNVRAALDLARAHRATALMATLHRVRDPIEASLGDRLAADLDEVYAAYAEARARLEAIRETGDDTLILRSRGEVRRKLGEIDLVRTRIQAEQPRYAELTSPDLPSTTVFRQWLARNPGPDAAALFYFVGERSSYGWIITADGVAAWTMPGREVLMQQVAGLVARITDRQAAATAELLASVRAVARTVLPPADHARPWPSTLIIVPDGPLMVLPFAALQVGDGDTGYRYLMELAELRQAPSLTMLLPAWSPPDPDGGGAMAVVVASPASVLTGARREADEIIGRWGSAGSAVLAAETLDAAGLQARLAGKNIIHFATHAWVDPANPALSGLSLGVSDGARRDLTLADVFRLRLDARLVVLSACQTGLGELLPGEGAMSLTRGFLYAGARQVLATQWRVADRASYRFARLFFEEVFDRDRPYPAALRAAQVRMLRDSPSERHPYHWAGYTISGY